MNRRGNRTKLPFTGGSLAVPPRKFITDFLSSHASPVQDEGRERSWYFEIKEQPSIGNSRGYIHYGTYGFESKFKDRRTKRVNYHRKTTDVEEIPLFYEFWCPPSCDFGFIVFQSFQGRSCISLVMSEMQTAFELKNPDILLRFKKLIPSDAAGSVFSAAPVKRLRLIKKNVALDIADRYLGNRTADQINMQLSLTTRKKGFLGRFDQVVSALKQNSTGVIVQDGVAYNEAVVDIRVGNRVRPVGVFGGDAEAGVIDLTESITRGSDGHPTYASMTEEVSDILKDFHASISNSQQ